jgi:hypothetical protein
MAFTMASSVRAVLKNGGLVCHADNDASDSDRDADPPDALYISKAADNGPLAARRILQRAEIASR